MKKGVLLAFGLFGLAGAVQADDYGFLDLRHRAFRSLIADPHELQLSVRLIEPISRNLLGEVAAGDYYSLYTRRLGDSGNFFQWCMGGGISSRFDLVSVQKDLLASDYTASMPLDVRLGRWATRVLPFHVSSHLGDDYIKRTGLLPEKYSFDAVKVLEAFEPTPRWRVYAGYLYTIRWSGTALGRHAVQSGLEWVSRAWARGCAETFWATDLQSWERVNWNPQIHIQLGVRFRHDPESRQPFSFYVEYAADRKDYGQLYKEKESHWGLGVKLGLW